VLYLGGWASPPPPPWNLRSDDMPQS
jgi:hypothetical protein